MKKIIFVLAFVGGMLFGFTDSIMRNQDGKLIVVFGRGFFTTLLISGGFIGALVSDGESIKNSILKCNKIAFVFFVAYFVGAMLSKLLYQN